MTTINLELDADVALRLAAFLNAFEQSIEDMEDATAYELIGITSIVQSEVVRAISQLPVEDIRELTRPSTES